MHDNPYRAEEGEVAEAAKPKSLARRLVSTVLITVGVFFALPGALVAIMGIDLLIRRPFRLSSDDVENLAFSFLFLIAAPALLIGAGIFVRRSRR